MSPPSTAPALPIALPAGSIASLQSAVSGIEGMMPAEFRAPAFPVGADPGEQGVESSSSTVTDELPDGARGASETEEGRPVPPVDAAVHIVTVAQAAMTLDSPVQPLQPLDDTSSGTEGNAPVTSVAHPVVETPAGELTGLSAESTGVDPFDAHSRAPSVAAGPVQDGEALTLHGEVDTARMDVDDQNDGGGSADQEVQMDLESEQSSS